MFERNRIFYDRNTRATMGKQLYQAGCESRLPHPTLNPMRMRSVGIKLIDGPVPPELLKEAIFLYNELENDRYRPSAFKKPTPRQFTTLNTRAPSVDNSIKILPPETNLTEEEVACCPSPLPPNRFGFFYNNKVMAGLIALASTVSILVHERKKFNF